ncbi:hypothetical protein LCI18_008376 [Fusarium solani-melongenae]|uniref:Uncharacterized protein n=1 Tax=Fusarium solani subsp. cucurbitae TaxID=2747967 RepID=A0ACD3Z8G9_FUSSC|nr:hypothetical protein LCI18_008376 [Fusarium solani-melongenae]
MAASVGVTASPEDSIVGYWTTRGTIGTFTCTSGSRFWPDLSVAGDTRTFARCEGDYLNIIVTACDGNTARNTDIKESTTGTWSCREYCTTFQIFNSYNGGDGTGVQYMIDCETFIGSPGGGSVSVFYRDVPSDPTTTEASAATHDSTTIDSTTIDSTESADSTQSSAPLRTGDARHNDGAKGLSSGAIAGIVIGAIAGLCLIACGFFIAYRMGRKRRGDPENPQRSFRDLLRAIIPNVSITWTKPKGNAQPLQRFAEDDIKKPRELLGDTGQTGQQLAGVRDQGLPKRGVPAVELPAEHVVEMADNGIVGLRTDAQ